MAKWRGMTPADCEEGTLVRYAIGLRSKMRSWISPCFSGAARSHAMTAAPTAGQRCEIDYAALPDWEIEQRSLAYQRKCGTPLANSHVRPCDSASGFEIFDLMEGQALVEERHKRTGSCRRTEP